MLVLRLSLLQLYSSRNQWLCLADATLSGNVEHMTAIERTAYPRFKRVLSAKDLEEVYTPTPQERFLALRSTKGTVAEVGFLVLLKTYQRLGRFIPWSRGAFLHS